jgi:hypothetical protein
MIEFNTLKFGDKVYIAKDTNNAFSKKKIKKIIRGVEWFRYDIAGIDEFFVGFKDYDDFITFKTAWA